ncbi:chromosome partitioning protein ParB [Rhizobium sp. KVB221]|uniref:Chromosome partitioning protein ParB n=1 Tax=Rhizobium setariae TaxID=2801340 RepID=A0A936YS25_9HYPH|nr:ParB-like protein [Rhizobium setariae]MBL0373742.1 chromosome partitioning protein ParB [Rhizobium setariae]
MIHSYEPKLEPVDISELRPTQMTVGMREVGAKRAEWRKRMDIDGPEFIGRHMVPVIVGPKNRYYLIDHHHLVRALHDEGVNHVLTSEVCDISYLSKQEFWRFVDHRGWAYPFDAEGRRREFADIPRSISELADDPYRSLAGALRQTGGYAKDTLPFSEFQWADYLRNRVASKLVERDFDAALAKAMELARGETASHLPGWCGPADGARHSALS